MKFSSFQSLIEEEFGKGFSAVIIEDTRLTECSDLTPRQLLEAGEDPREVWFPICRQFDVPRDRWHGKNKPKRHAD